MYSFVLRIQQKCLKYMRQQSRFVSLILCVIRVRKFYQMYKKKLTEVVKRKQFPFHELNINICQV